MSVTVVADSVGLSLGGRNILDEVSIELHPGEMLALVGPNGAGKSTLLSLFAGDRRPMLGTVTLNGRPLHSYSTRELAKKRAVQLQQAQLSFGFRVREVVEMGRAPWPSDSADNQIVNEAMAEAGIEHLADRFYPSLSGGEQARVSFARVLAQRTDLVLLDEPTAALDLGYQERTLAIARKLTSAGRTVLVVLHDLRLAAAYAHRIAVLGQGRIVAVGKPFEVLTNAILTEVYRHPISVFEHEGAVMIKPDRVRTSECEQSSVFLNTSVEMMN